MQAFANVVAKLCDANPLETLRQGLQPAQRGPQQQLCSLRILALPVMKRRSHLDQALQESLLRLGRNQPHTLPILMCGKELARAIMRQTFGKFSVRPIKSHQFEF